MLKVEWNIIYRLHYWYEVFTKGVRNSRLVKDVWVSKGNTSTLVVCEKVTEPLTFPLTTNVDVFPLLTHSNVGFVDCSELSSSIFFYSLAARTITCLMPPLWQVNKKRLNGSILLHLSSKV